MRLILIPTILTAFASAALCQEFEVVSVKPNKSMSTSSRSRSDRGMITATNVTLKSLIVRAYGIRDYQLDGPDWLSSERFDVAARFPEALPQDSEKYNAGLSAMMRKMLEDRFNLTAHREQRILAVYGLIVGKGGIKFPEVPDGDSHNQDTTNTHFTGTCVSMNAFAAYLSRQGDLPLDLPVLDMTGLKGFYNLKLDWVPEPRQSGDIKGDLPVVSEAPSGLTLPVALQEQLGLRLETRKAAIEILVVDHAEKVPTEN